MINHTFKICILALIFILCSTIEGNWVIHSVNAATADKTASEAVEQYVLRWQSDDPYSFYLRDLFKYETEDVVREARKFSQNEDEIVRSDAIAVEFHSAVASGRKELLMDTVEYLCEIIKDVPNLKDSEVASKLLTKLNSDNFSRDAKQSLVTRIGSAKPTDELVLLVGVAQLSSQVDWLLALERDGKQHIRRRATLALARIGHDSSIDKVIANYKRKANEPTSRLLNDAKDLQYTRSIQAINELIKELNSDIVYPRTHDTDPISHAAVAITHLHLMLDGFPVEKTDYSRVTQEDVTLCREWVAKQESFTIIK